MMYTIGKPHYSRHEEVSQLQRQTSFTQTESRIIWTKEIHKECSLVLPRQTMYRAFYGKILEKVDYDVQSKKTSSHFIESFVVGPEGKIEFTGKIGRNLVRLIFIEKSMQRNTLKGKTFLRLK